MSAINCLLYAFPDSALYGRRLASALGLKAAAIDLHRFPDGETRVRVQHPAPRHALLVRSLHDPNAKLIETVLAADALRRAGARRVTLLAPYLPYMRQDRVFHPGEPISQRVVGGLLGRAFDRVLTIEAHLHRVHKLSQVISPSSLSLSAAPVLAQWVEHSRRDTLVVGPDEESEPWIREIASLARVPWIVGRKERLSDRKVQVHFPPSSCRRAVIVDDIASSGVTIAVAARALKRMGIRTVEAIVVHAIFAPGALTRIRTAGLRRIISCDTIPHPSNSIVTAPLLVEPLRKILRG